MEYLYKKPKTTAPLARSVSVRALVFQIEANIVNVYRTMIRRDMVQGQPTNIDSWDPCKFLTERNGIRLIEEITRRTKYICSNEQIDCVALTLPGTLIGTSIIDGSSRLGIFETINVTDQCKKLSSPPTYVFHDAECLAMGEALLNVSPENTGVQPRHDTFVYVLVDEGVGSSIFIDGRPYRGAGVAGHIGRMVTQPYGLFNPIFNSCATLEVFAARPWVSENLVNEYRAEQDKAGALPPNSSSFRAAVAAAAASGNSRQLTFQLFADGVNSSDPLMLTVLEDAAQNLSIAINAIITILNPPLVILGGGMITEIPEFAHKVINYSRRRAFAGVWNETTLLVSKSKRDAQIVGAAHFLSRVIYEDY